MFFVKILYGFKTIAQLRHSHQLRWASLWKVVFLLSWILGGNVTVIGNNDYLFWLKPWCEPNKSASDSLTNSLPFSLTEGEIFEALAQ